MVRDMDPTESRLLPYECPTLRTPIQLPRPVSAPSRTRAFVPSDLQTPGLLSALARSREAAPMALQTENRLGQADFVPDLSVSHPSVSEGVAVVTLAGELDLSRAEELREKLAHPGGTERACSVRVDLAAVSASWIPVIYRAHRLRLQKDAAAAGCSFSGGLRSQGHCRDVSSKSMGLVEQGQCRGPFQPVRGLKSSRRKRFVAKGVHAPGALLSYIERPLGNDWGRTGSRLSVHLQPMGAALSCIT